MARMAKDTAPKRGRPPKGETKRETRASAAKTAATTTTRGKAPAKTKRGGRSAA